MHSPHTHRLAPLMLKRLAYFGIVGISLVSCSGSKPRPQGHVELGRRPVSTDPVTLIGTVIDEDTESGLPSVRVRLERSASRAETSSDSLGRFQLRIDSAGLWSVQAQADDYITEKRELHVSCGTGIWTVEGWSPAACPVPPESTIIRMRRWSQPPSPDSMIHGRVIDERTGMPLQAQLMFDTRSGTLSSAQTGEYVLRGPCAGGLRASCKIDRLRR